MSNYFEVYYVNFSRIEYVFVVLKSLQNESLPLFQEDL